MAVLLGTSAGCTSDLLVVVPFTDAGLEGGVTVTDSSSAQDASMPDFGAARVSAFSHTCATLDGAVYCWGKNAETQLGIVEMTAHHPRAVRVLERDMVDVCAGEAHTCALRRDGLVFCWGDNLHGQLGIGDFDRRNSPTPVPGTNFARIACGGLGTTCAITAAGELFCWGENFEGKLGLADERENQPDSPVPVRVKLDESVAQVSIGQGHACAVATSGALYCWGRNTNGQLGLGEGQPEQVRRPLRVLAEGSFSRVAAGQRHTCAIHATGELSCWGDNDGPLLGVAATSPIVLLPQRVGEEADYADVAAGWFHTCARKHSGALFCWGDNVDGQLGLGSSAPQAMPTQVGTSTGWRALAVGHFHSCAFRHDGLFCWGMNKDGQLGLNDTMTRYVPYPVSLPFRAN